MGHPGRMVHGMLVGMLSVRSFGRLADGTEVKLYTVQREGIEAAFLDYGARLVSLKVPDARGADGDVVLGYASLDEYVEDKSVLRREWWGGWRIGWRVGGLC